MADINLLQNQLTDDTTYRFKKYLDKIEFGLLIVIGLVFLLGGGLIIWNTVSLRNQSRASQEIEQRKVDLASTISAKRDNVVKTQAQIKEVQGLLEAHIYWSPILEAVNKSAITGIRFTQLSGAGQGQILLTGLASDFTTLATFTKRLNEIEGVKQVVINSSSIAETATDVFYNFSLTINFDPSILQYQPKD